MPGLFWRRGVFYVGMRFEIPEPLQERQARPPMAMVSLESGYTPPSRGTARARLILRTVELARATPSAPARSPQPAQQGTRVLGLVDDKVVEGTGGAQAGGCLPSARPGRRASVNRGLVGQHQRLHLRYRARGLRVASSEWDITNRWSRTPDWSGLAASARTSRRFGISAPLKGTSRSTFTPGQR